MPVYPGYECCSGLTAISTATPAGDVCSISVGAAICSNCGTEYLNSTLSKLNIEQYFNYIECHGDNNLPKNEIVRKILNKFSGLKGAVVGDKIHDVLAARENNVLSIGALYGYGKDEPKQADLTIDNFSDLLEIFNKNI